jgi:integrase
VLVDVKKYKPATVNRILSAVRGVLREAWGLDLIDADAYHKARAVKLVSASTEPAGRDVEADELRLLFAACEDSPIGNRNAVVLALLYGCGLRRAEVARVDLADYNRGANTIHVHGKGKKERTVHLPAGARRAVDAWLEVRGKEPGPLICPVHKSGKVIMRRLDAAAIWFAIRGLVKRTNVAKLTPHDFRRTLTGDLLDAGVDLVTVQTMLGHADPKVTARYDRRPGRVRAAAAAKVNVPFNR